MSDTTRFEIDLDIHSPEYFQRKVDFEADVRSQCPVAWTSRYGGHWAVSGHEAVAGGLGLQSTELFTAGMFEDDEGRPAGGVTIPSTGEYRALPLESHNEEWKNYRKLVSGAFTPRAVQQMQPRVESFVAEVIDHMIERGEADFVMQVAWPITALSTCSALGLPIEDWHGYTEGIHQTFMGMPGDGSSETGIAGIHKRLTETIAARRAEPGDGLVDSLINAEVDGRPLDDAEIKDLLYGILVGGVDTTAGLMTGSVRYLQDKPDLARRLIDDEAFMLTATEEFLRYISPAVGLARTATKDNELGGQSIKAGDRLWFMFRAANWDPTEFESPEQVDLERSPNRHVAFGAGIHKCLGASLARLIFRTTLREFLSRVPDYQIVPERVQPYTFACVNAGFAHLGIRYTPGKQVLDKHLFDHI